MLRTSAIRAVVGSRWSGEQLDDRDQALAWLEKAIAAGYTRERIERSPSLSELRKDRLFGGLLTRSHGIQLSHVPKPSPFSSLETRRSTMFSEIHPRAIGRCSQNRSRWDAKPRLVRIVGNLSPLSPIPLDGRKQPSLLFFRLSKGSVWARNAATSCKARWRVRGHRELDPRKLAPFPLADRP